MSLTCHLLTASISIGTYTCAQNGPHMKASMLLIVDLVTMDAIPFAIKQPHCSNPARQAPAQTPPRSFDSSSGMMAPYLLEEKF